MPPLKQLDTRASGAPLATAKQIVTSLLQKAGPMPSASVAFVGALGCCIDPRIEDEALLALPQVPKHDVCPDSKLLDVLKSEKPSPFAGLKDLKS